jgi:dienelactone hydrolase
MREAAVDWQLVHYGNAVHSFTDPGAGNNPAAGSAYNERADARSWKAMKVFLEEVFDKAT